MKLTLFKNTKKKKVFNLRKEAEIDPFFYWKRILIMMSVILFVVAVASFGVYFLVSKDAFITNESKEKVKSLVSVELEEKKLDDIFTKFENRKLNREQIVKNINQASDSVKNPITKTEPVSATSR